MDNSIITVPNAKRTARRLLVCFAGVVSATDATVEHPLAAIQPRAYVAYQTGGSITVDGHLDEPSWQRAEWTRDFINIEGQGPPPRLRTRAKLVWDEQFLYLAADIEEPDVWATLKERDATIYHDNDFEVFVDADGDTHGYWELEVNALGTVWDQFLLRPPRDGGISVTAADLPGLRTEVVVWGTLNDGRDHDEGWSLEMAIPWTALKQGAHRRAPPRDGDYWRLNFSRVEWSVEADASRGQYEKIPGRHEETWAWSPQGIVDMHYPELWGFVHFSEITVGSGSVEAATPPEEEAKRILREIYYRQVEFRRETGAYTSRLDSLGMEHRILRNFLWPPQVSTGDYGFEAWLEEVIDLHDDGHVSRWVIRQDSQTQKVDAE